MSQVVCNEKATFERKAVARDPVYKTETEVWEIVADRWWVEIQDVLPSRAETTENGLRSAVQQARLRVRNSSLLTADLRVTLHGRGDRVMQIISGPALLNDRIHSEFMLEGYPRG